MILNFRWNDLDEIYKFHTLLLSLPSKKCFVVTSYKHTRYAVTLPTGAVQDRGGNPFSAEGFAYVFTTASNAYPVSISPVDGAPGVSPTANITILFSQAISWGGTVDTIVVRAGAGAEADPTPLREFSEVPGDVSWGFAQGTLTIEEKVLVLECADPFVGGAEYELEMAVGSLVDMAGFWFGGLRSGFRIRDVTPPSIVERSPAPDVLVPPQPVFQIKFSEAVQIARDPNASLTLIGSFGDYSAPLVVVNGSSVITTSCPFLNSSARYSITLDPEAVVDMEGNFFAGLFDGDWTVEVFDLEPPVLVTSSPTIGAVGVPAKPNILLLFNEDMQTGSGAVYLVSESGGESLLLSVSDSRDVLIAGSEVLLSPSSRLDYEANYSIKMGPGVFMDVAGNPFGGVARGEIWFITQDVTPPALLKCAGDTACTSPTHRDTNVPPGAAIVLTFDEPIAVNVDVSGWAVLSPEQGDAVALAMGDVSVRAEGVTLTIFPPQPLAPLMKYTVTVTRGAVADAQGNPWAGLEWRELEFTTGSGGQDVRKIPTRLVLPNQHVPVGEKVEYAFSHRIIPNCETTRLNGSSVIPDFFEAAHGEGLFAFRGVPADAGENLAELHILCCEEDACEPGLDYVATFAVVAHAPNDPGTTVPPPSAQLLPPTPPHLPTTLYGPDRHRHIDVDSYLQNGLVLGCIAIGACKETLFAAAVEIYKTNVFFFEVMLRNVIFSSTHHAPQTAPSITSGTFANA